MTWRKWEKNGWMPVFILIPNFLPVDSQWQICLWYRLEIYQSFYQNWWQKYAKICQNKWKMKKGKKAWKARKYWKYEKNQDFICVPRHSSFMIMHTFADWGNTGQNKAESIENTTVSTTKAHARWIFWSITQEYSCKEWVYSQRNSNYSLVVIYYEWWLF